MIYDRKEMFVLVLLGLLVALFSFTLGLHFGKKVNHHALLNEWKKQTFIATQVDVLPSREELAEQMKHVDDSVELSLGQALKKEVAKTGIQLDEKLQVDLPEKPKSKESGATLKKNYEVLSEHSQTKKESVDGFAQKQLKETVKEEKKVQEDTQLKIPLLGKYTLQVGSFPSRGEAQQYLSALKGLKTKGFLYEIDLKEKGRWFRIYLGGYPTKKEATRAGNRLQAENIIQNFFVSRTPKKK